LQDARLKIRKRSCPRNVKCSISVHEMGKSIQLMNSDVAYNRRNPIK